jgi:hypothetical protein
MKLRFPLYVGFLGVVIAYASVLYIIQDANINYSNKVSVTEDEANSDVVSQETLSHVLLRYTIVILDPGILIVDRFSAQPGILANELFNERLRVLTLIINFCLYYMVGYLMSLIFMFLKGKGKSLKTSLRG